MNRLTLTTLASLTLLGCSKEAEQAIEPLARPVTVFVLEETTPPPGRLIPGVVTPYRQTQLAFEVTGRVEFIINSGEEIVGEQIARDGSLLQTGDVIAKLDPAPFERALKQAQQRLEAERLRLKAEQIQLDTVLKARLSSTQSQAEAAKLNTTYARDEVKALESAVQLAETTLERNRGLLPTGAVSDITVRQSENELQAQNTRLSQGRTLVTTREREHDAALAAIAEIEGDQALKRANNKVLEASIVELEAAVADAQSNLDHCVLYAPFGGRITEKFVGEGSIVQAGSPVTTLTMMSPIEIQIEVSAEDDERLVVGTDANVFPMKGNQIDFEREIHSTLYVKEGVANAKTRTFTLGLIAPNKRRIARPELVGLPTAPYLIPVLDNPLDRLGGDGMYAIAEAIGDVDGDPYVLKVRDLTQGARTTESLKGKLEADRLSVNLGERTIRVGSFFLIEVLRTEGLNARDLLVPMPTRAHESGFVVDDNRWLLRPGDLVQVSLDRGSLPAGFYVPIQAVCEVNGATTIFVVDQEDRAREISVEALESSGEQRRVVSEQLSAGSLVVSQGAHFLQDGDPVIRSKPPEGASQ